MKYLVLLSLLFSISAHAVIHGSCVATRGPDGRWTAGAPVYMPIPFGNGLYSWNYPKGSIPQQPHPDWVKAKEEADQRNKEEDSVKQNVAAVNERIKHYQAAYAAHEAKRQKDRDDARAAALAAEKVEKARQQHVKEFKDYMKERERVIKEKWAREKGELDYAFQSYGDFKRDIKETYRSLYTLKPDSPTSEQARDMGMSAVRQADRTYAQGKRWYEEAKLYHEIGKGFLDIATNVTPLGSMGRGLFELTTGRDMIDSRALTRAERAISGASIFLGAPVRSLPRVIQWVRTAYGVYRIGKDLDQALTDAESIMLPPGFKPADARQEGSPGALKVRDEILQGDNAVYRRGSLENAPDGSRQHVNGSYFWVKDNPKTTPNFDQLYGTTNSRGPTPNDFVVKGRIEPGSRFITRGAPAHGANEGGGIEIVVENPNNVKVEWFSTYDGLKP